MEEGSATLTHPGQIKEHISQANAVSWLLVTSVLMLTTLRVSVVTTRSFSFLKQADVWMTNTEAFGFATLSLFGEC